MWHKVPAVSTAAEEFLSAAAAATAEPAAALPALLKKEQKKVAKALKTLDRSCDRAADKLRAARERLHDEVDATCEQALKKLAALRSKRQELFEKRAAEVARVQAALATNKHALNQAATDRLLTALAVLPCPSKVSVRAPLGKIEMSVVEFVGEFTAELSANACVVQATRETGTNFWVDVSGLSLEVEGQEYPGALSPGMFTVGEEDLRHADCERLTTIFSGAALPFATKEAAESLLLSKLAPRKACVSSPYTYNHDYRSDYELSQTIRFVRVYHISDEVYAGSLWRFAWRTEGTKVMMATTTYMGTSCTVVDRCLSRTLERYIDCSPDEKGLAPDAMHVGDPAKTWVPWSIPSEFEFTSAYDGRVAGRRIETGAWFCWDSLGVVVPIPRPEGVTPADAPMLWLRNGVTLVGLAEEGLEFYSVTGVTATLLLWRPFEEGVTPAALPSGPPLLLSEAGPGEIAVVRQLLDAADPITFDQMLPDVIGDSEYGEDEEPDDEIPCEEVFKFVWTVHKWDDSGAVPSVRLAVRPHVRRGEFACIAFPDQTGLVFMAYNFYRRLLVFYPTSPFLL